MNEETQQPDSDNPDVVRSPKNTDRDGAGSGDNGTDEADVVRKLVVVVDEADDSPKNDRPADLENLTDTPEEPEKVRKPIEIKQLTEEDDPRSPKNTDRG